MIFIGVVSNGLNSIHGSHNLGKRSFCSLININIPPLLNRSSPCAWICSSRFVSLSLCDSLALAIQPLVWPTLGIPNLNPSLCNGPPSLLSFCPLLSPGLSSLIGFLLSLAARRSTSQEKHCQAHSFQSNARHQKCDLKI